MKYRLLVITLVCISPIFVNAQTARYARVISQNANLRDTPSIASSITQEVAEETLVKVLDEKLPWYVVRIGNRVGWMHGDTLEFISVTTAAPRIEPTAPSIQSTVPLMPSVPSAPEVRGSRRSSPRQTPTSPSTGGYGGYIRGPRGGCYYISGSGRKVYVDRSMCN